MLAKSTQTVYYFDMERKISESLVDWKRSKSRKPLVLRGARQVGKTYILKQFGAQEYRNCVYLNFEQDPKLAHFFAENLQPEHILLMKILIKGILHYQ